MAAYVIANVDVHDPVEYEAYRSRTPDTVAAHGGRFIVRGGEIEILEGNPDIRRLVVIEFPDRAAARRWYDSAEYQALIPFRTSASTGALFIVDGFSHG